MQKTSRNTLRGKTKMTTSPKILHVMWGGLGNYKRVLRCAVIIQGRMVTLSLLTSTPTARLLLANRYPQRKCKVFSEPGGALVLGAEYPAQKRVTLQVW